MKCLCGKETITKCLLMGSVCLWVVYISGVQLCVYLLTFCLPYNTVVFNSLHIRLSQLLVKVGFDVGLRVFYVTK